MTVLRRSDLRRPRFFFGVLRRRLLAEVARKTGRMVRVRIDPGLPALLVPGDDLVGHYLREDDFEARERDFVRRALAPGDVFVDVGAHVGLYTVLAGHRVGGEGAVLSVEPNPDSFAMLEHNIARHRLAEVVRLRQAAVSDRDGAAELHIPRRYQAAWSSLGDPAVETARTTSVATVALDSLLGDLQPFLMKIDVEGWERRVLSGGRKLFDASDAPHLLIEFSDIVVEPSGRTASPLAEDLGRLGYRLYRYDEHRVVLDPVAAGEYARGNLVASKRIGELRARLAATS